MVTRECYYKDTSLDMHREIRGMLEKAAKVDEMRI
jgi:hypothetical protein